MIQIAAGGRVEPAHAPRGAGDDAGAPARPDAGGAAAEPPVDAAGAGSLSRAATRRVDALRPPPPAPERDAQRPRLAPPRHRAPRRGDEHGARRGAPPRPASGRRAPPTLRFFAWRPATVSLGYGQPLDDAVDRARRRAMGVGLVRRPTGGSAILHEGPEREVTYSVVARRRRLSGRGRPARDLPLDRRGARRRARALGAAADMVPLVQPADRAASPAFCFARAGATRSRSEAGSSSAAPSAGRARLVPPARLRPARRGSGSDPRGLPARGRSHGGDDHARRRAGALPGFDAVVEALAAGLAEALGTPLAPAGLSPDEIALAESLVAGKYGTEAWTVEGRLPEGVGAAGAPAGAIS